MHEKNRFIKSAGGVSIAIFLCRILGLFREILLAKFFGGGMIMTAWGLAFLLPNLFRRLLGEGALGTALVPIVTYSIEKEGREAARKKLLSVFVALSLILALLCILLVGISFALRPFVVRDSGRFALEIIPIIMPYAFFICMVGIVSSVLNSVGRYFLVALSALSLNIFMVGCLLLLGPKLTQGFSQLSAMKYLALSVLVSGVFQLVALLILLWKEKMLPSFAEGIAQIFRNPVLGELYRLTLPGIVGASVLQLSMVIDKSMAYFIGDQAVPALNFSDRIVDLPIGIFAVAMGSVFLPKMSKSAANKDFDGMSDLLIFALKNILFVSIPVSVFLTFFDKSVISAFYMRGRFGETELMETSLAMLFYAPGIPFFCAAKILSSGFHSRKDMKTPLIIAIICLVLNVTLNLILMSPLKQGGIALATVCSSAFNCALMFIILRKELRNLSFRPIIKDVFKMLLCALLAAVCAKITFHIPLLHSWKIPAMPHDFIPLIASGASFCLAYLACSLMTRSQELSEWMKILRR